MERKMKYSIIISLGATTLILVIIFSSTFARTKTGSQVLPEEPPDSLSCPIDFDPMPLIVVSLDGFKPDYLKRGLTPTIQEMMDKGSSTPYMLPVFTTKTFPNHYSIVTGLYADQHGIISNVMSDTSFDKEFSFKTEESRNSRWWGGEPIWNTIRKNNLSSATYFWVGSEAPINGHHPTYWFPYDGSVPSNTRVETVLEWLSLPADKRPFWISMYLSEPDSTGHRYGPDSEEVNTKLKEVDGVVRSLLEGIKAMGLLSCVNVIILSDHGMTSSGPERVIDLSEFIPEKYWEGVKVSPGVAAMIHLENEDLENSEPRRREIEESLTCKRDEFKLFRREDLPLRLHYSKFDRRIGDYVFMTDEGYGATFKIKGFIKGVHGHDYKFSSMQAIFLGYGPAFKSNFTVKPFRNVELYSLMCHLLKVPPSPNNGTGKLLYSILNSPLPNAISAKDERTVFTELFENDQQNYENFLSAKCSSNTSVYELSVNLLNMTTEQKTLVQNTILPLGIPLHQSSDENLKILFHPDHITGYSTNKKIPLWTSFLISSVKPQRESRWHSDFRLSYNETLSCDHIDRINSISTFNAGTLFPAEFSHDETASNLAFLNSNAVPFHVDVQPQWEALMKEILPSLKENSTGEISVTVGPIFDESMASYLDPNEMLTNITIPSHYFAIVVKCRDVSDSLSHCPPDDLLSTAFIYPQKQSVKNCFSSAIDFASMFKASIQDVEDYTNLMFFPELNMSERLELITYEYSIFGW